MTAGKKYSGNPSLDKFNLIRNYNPDQQHSGNPLLDKHKLLNDYWSNPTTAENLGAKLNAIDNHYMSKETRVFKFIESFFGFLFLP